MPKRPIAKPKAAHEAPAPAAPPQPGPESSVVVAFRLRRREVHGLAEALPNIVTGNSPHLLARKVARDFVDGKLVYLNRRDKLDSREGS